MGAIEAVQAYINAWNMRSSEAVLASLVPGGTYHDPTTSGPLAGDALAAHLASLWEAFPDLEFEVASLAETGSNRAAIEWVMRGTNAGPFRGLPPTGRTVELKGADFIDTERGKVRTVTGYFDAAAVPLQLGLQVLVQPEQVGPFRFGDSIEVQTGRRRAPGAISVTALYAIDDDMVARVREDSRTILAEMLEMDGFIGATVGKIGRRMFTVSAWDSPEHPRQLMRDGRHGAALPAFFEGARATSGFTSVWAPVRINAYWVRCLACGRMARGDGDLACRCGAALPPHPPYW